MTEILDRSTSSAMKPSKFYSSMESCVLLWLLPTHNHPEKQGLKKERRKGREREKERDTERKVNLLAQNSRHEEEWQFTQFTTTYQRQPWNCSRNIIIIIITMLPYASGNHRFLNCFYFYRMTATGSGTLPYSGWVDLKPASACCCCCCLWELKFYL